MIYPVSSDFLFVIPAGDLLFRAGPQRSAPPRRQRRGHPPDLSDLDFSQSVQYGTALRCATQVTSPMRILGCRNRTQGQQNRRGDLNEKITVHWYRFNLGLPALPRLPASAAAAGSTGSAGTAWTGRTKWRARAARTAGTNGRSRPNWEPRVHWRPRTTGRYRRYRTKGRHRRPRQVRSMPRGAASLYGRQRKRKVCIQLDRKAES